MKESIVDRPKSITIRVQIRNTTNRVLWLYKTTQIGGVNHVFIRQHATQNTASINTVNVVSRKTEACNVK